MEEKINNLELKNTTNEEIENLIYYIRGKQVMLDSDVAMLYQYSTKRINETVRRNKERFPENFCFQLTENEIESLRLQIATLKKNKNNSMESLEEINSLRSQIATLKKNENNNINDLKETDSLRFQIGTLKKGRGEHRKYLPYVFTEQGIAMLSGLLKNEIAVQVSISIINAFVKMREFLIQNGQVFQRLTNLEYKQLENEKNFSKVFNLLESKEESKERIFFEGQIWDSYSLIIDIIKKAEKKITIIDNYIDDSILKMLAKKNKNVEVVLLTSQRSNIQKLDIQKFNKEYPILKLAKTDKFHDRFIMLDDKILYHLGASIKDLGKKCFAITKVESKEIIEMMNKIHKY